MHSLSHWYARFCTAWFPRGRDHLCTISFYIRLSHIPKNFIPDCLHGYFVLCKYYQPNVDILYIYIIYTHLNYDLFYFLCNISIYTRTQINWPTFPINPLILSPQGKHFCLWQLLSWCCKQITNYIIFCQTQCCTEVLWFGFLRVFSYQQQEVKSPQRRIGLIIGTFAN